MQLGRHLEAVVGDCVRRQRCAGPAITGEMRLHVRCHGRLPMQQSAHLAKTMQAMVDDRQSYHHTPPSVSRPSCQVAWAGATISPSTCHGTPC